MAPFNVVPIITSQWLASKAIYGFITERVFLRIGDEYRVNAARLKKLIQIAKERCHAITYLSTDPVTSF